MKTSFRIQFFIILLAVSALAQTPVTSSQQQQERRQNQSDQEQQRKMGTQRQAREKTLGNKVEDALKAPARNQNKRLSKEEIAEQNRRKEEAIAELNTQFAISAEYQNKYSDFLKQKNTGIARMFPDTNCNVGLTVTVTDLERCSNIPQVKGGGAHYSIKMNWIPQYLPLSTILDLFKQSDIYYNGNSLLFGNNTTQSIVSEIGDVNLEEITLKSPAFRFLGKFKPSPTKTKFLEQTKLLAKGITANGYFYSTLAPVKLNSVYVFRSISFSPNPYILGGVYWNTDLSAAFRIVGREDDGSIIFIWKKLKEKPAPYLINK